MGIVFVGPKNPSPATLRPAVCWTFVKLAKAVVAYWHVAGGARATLGGEWTLSTWVSFIGIKEACAQVGHVKSPILFPDTRPLTTSAACSPPGKFCSGQ